ncbi:MAG: RHS repeat-associated core domain-containing protein, partial [Sandaracinaceae bacterium]|nr:RHS repeat-associated core domain-containing protein [Sandaracinaceae bacterium]
MRQRYRYDSGNQRTIKQTLDKRVGASDPERISLYVYPGDFERRGLVRSALGDEYVASSGLDTETQYLVGGARIVWKHGGGITGLDREQRVTVPLTDLIQTTAAVLDLNSGALLEYSSYYPNGARESYRHAEEESIAAEPSGFTGKESDEEVGLVYFGERYLISRIGRWASPDPLQVHAVGGGEALNGYHYVGGNLLQARDPLGLDVAEGVQEFETQAQFEAHRDSGGAPSQQAQRACASGRAVCAAVVGAPGSLSVYHYTGGEYVYSEEASRHANDLARSLEVNRATDWVAHGAAYTAAAVLTVWALVEVGAVSGTLQLAQWLGANFPRAIGVAETVVTALNDGAIMLPAAGAAGSAAVAEARTGAGQSLLRRAWSAAGRVADDVASGVRRMVRGPDAG